MGERDDGTTEPPGTQAPIAAKVLMKVFYGARYCRPDLLRAITFLACCMTKWPADCDRRLHRLRCYLSCTLDHIQMGWIGDKLEDLRLHIYSDADFAGCQTRTVVRRACSWPWKARTAGSRSHR